MQHGGNIYQFAQTIACLPEQVIDFSANINPQQAVDWHELAVSLTPYPDSNYSTLQQAIRQRYHIPSALDIELYNGASAAIFSLLRHLKPRTVVLYSPIYLEYQRIAQQLGCKLLHINRLTTDTTQAVIPEGSTVIFVNPATPDGQFYALESYLADWRARNCTVIIDESFLDFCSNTSVLAHASNTPSLYLVKSMSKFYGCAGIRVGFVGAATALIAKLRQQEPAWKLSSLDAAYMEAAVSNYDFIGQTQQQTQALRQRLATVLQQSGLFATIYPSQANFILARLKHGDGYCLQQRLATARILLRVCDNFDGLDSRYVRFAVKSASDIDYLAVHLSHV